ncbi:MAG: UDP-N-acetylmuramoyl-tripeptide--D-alanyl-D-alanine ligase [Sulfurovum sp.]|nr:UDP-N-acetylmuramoyl-tripeptide--D-alanyl-D-alanine ligase [Sulfurovum sp.]
MNLMNVAGHMLFLAAIGYYLITNLQWYIYKISRVLFNHTKPWWHLLYFVIPYVLYLSANYLGGYGYIVAILYVIMIYMWHKGLDKPLVWTGRVRRFSVLLMFVTLYISFTFHNLSVLIPLIVTYIASYFIEKVLFGNYRRRAEQKLDDMEDMITIGITASYGKTSIKNFIAHLLSSKYRTYPTPRSVNTFGGVVRDINEDLPEDTEIYVVEMGARGKGDIAEISTFVNPQYVIVGQIGPAHIEYFKTLENIRNTKMEIIQSDRLKEAWVHESAQVKPEDYVHIFGDDIKDIEATLDGTSFTLDGVRYSASILGAFNAVNLAVSVKIARVLGLTNDEIQQGLSTLKAVDHRLQRIDAGGKLILDDSYNGNIDGMMTAFDLVSTHGGRKVLITPGLVEVDDEFNEQVAKRANEVFDLVVATGDLNYEIFKKYIDDEKLLKLPIKSAMEQMLAEQTYPGDLILFANDAPSFV